MEFLKSLLLISILYTFQAGSSTKIELPSAYKECKQLADTIILGPKEAKLMSETLNISHLQTIIKKIKLTCQQDKLTSYILTDRIRTHIQTLFVVLKNDKIKDIQVLKFEEPDRYRAPKLWVEQFYKKDKLEEIDGLSGATMTRQSTINVVKQVLYLEKKT